MKRPTHPRVIVFDLDGTLIDSLAIVLRAITHALEPYGQRPTSEIFAKLGGPPERFLATLLDDTSHIPAAVARMEAFHRQHWRDIQPFEGARAFFGRTASWRSTTCRLDG